MDAEEEKMQRRKKLYKVVSSLIPLVTVFFLMAMNPFPHIIRLIGFIGAWVFAIGFFISDILLVVYLIKCKEKLNERTRKFLTVMSILSPILSMIFMVILIFFVYPEI